ncbi:hypothetical protein T484DRAFT_1886895 [Baffinella frigidus]|nr:hypothetical protein T484DRAFT_1886895 [Cryptophyta sp. CCMP2293]
MHKADNEVVNCVEAHPFLAVLATSGIDSDVKVWVPTRDSYSDMGAARNQACDTEHDRAPAAYFKVYILGARRNTLGRDAASNGGSIRALISHHFGTSMEEDEVSFEEYLQSGERDDDEEDEESSSSGEDGDNDADEE